MFSKSSSLLVVVAACAIISAGAHDFSECSGSPKKLGIDSVTLNPDPPQPGKDLSVILTGKNGVAVSDGAKAVLSIKMFGVVLAKIPFNVCTQMGITCPVAAGTDWTGKISYPIPSAAPPHVSIQAEVDIYADDGEKTELDCIDMKITVGSSSQLLGYTPTLQRTAEDLTRREFEFLFEAWMSQHQRSFSSASEYSERLSKFSRNIKMIERHNVDASKTYKLAMNEYGHMDWTEFRSTYIKGGFGAAQDLKKKSSSRRSLLSATFVEAASLPESVDWVSKGAVTDVKNQGKCGSCWSFSATGSVEGAYFLKTGKLVNFSEEELVDCSSDAGNKGCNGGLMDNAFTWLETSGGICSLEDYPYTAGEGTPGSCKKSKCSPVQGTVVKGFTDVNASEPSLMAAVAQQPVSIAIEADQMAFQFYSHGVFTGQCGTKVDHGVLVVGYGKLDGNTYWKVKNSWGPSWGLDGYILLERGKDQDGGQCGILGHASFPELA